jgi:hypothetical protein
MRRLDPEPAIQQAVSMKATFENPDELHREVIAGTATVDWRNFKSPLAHLVPENAADHSMDAMWDSIVTTWNDDISLK